MADLLAQGQSWLADKQARYAAQPVLYARGETSAPVSATIGRSEFNVEDVSGQILRVETMDFIVEANALLYAMSQDQFEPKPGDRITYNAYIHEVSPPGPGMPHWRWAETSRIRYRIHTKQIGPVT